MGAERPAAPGMDAGRHELARRVADRIGQLGVFAMQLESYSAVEARTLVAGVERLGFGAIWVPESLTGREVFSQSAILLAASARLVVATGIANVWARDPVAMAAGALALADAFPGRFVLGLGLSQASIVEQRGGSYARPLAYLRRYLRAMDAARAAAPEPLERPCRLLAALGPRLLRIAAEQTDGAHPYFVPVEHTRLARRALGPGPLLAVGQAVVLDSRAADARGAVRAHLARYLSRENYVRSLLRLGWTELDLRDGGSAALAEALVASGDVARIRRRVAEQLEAGADHVCIHVLAPLGCSALLETLGEIAATP